MRFKQNSDYDAQFAAAYHELFEPLAPSEKLLAATRRLYHNAPHGVSYWSGFGRFWPAATLCAACLLLTIAFNVQLWPQPDNMAPQNNMQMRVANETSQTTGYDNAGAEDKAAGSESLPMSRMAEPSIPAMPAMQATQENESQAIANLTDSPNYGALSKEDTQICHLPLFDYDSAKLNSSAPIMEIMQPTCLANFIFKILKRLVLW